MPYRPGFEEDGFLRTLFPFEPHEIELKAENCTKVSVVNQIIENCYVAINLFYVNAPSSVSRLYLWKWVNSKKKTFSNITDNNKIAFEDENIKNDFSVIISLVISDSRSVIIM